VIPVDQLHQTEEDPKGDCLAACVASIFEMPLSEVPDFDDTHGAHWWRGMIEWMEPMGLQPTFPTRYSWRKRPRYHAGPFVGMVESRVVQGTGSLHAVVCRGEEMVHDPNPLSRAVDAPYRFRGDFGFEVWDFGWLKSVRAGIAESKP